MNQFWCDLNFLVGLSEQSNNTLSISQGLVHEDRFSFYSSKGDEAGTARLVRLYRIVDVRSQESMWSFASLLKLKVLEDLFNFPFH